ncbi:16S rRNA (uracil(1498)-N(3))-methyltransferase [Clostridium sp. D2Q-11]|uniref:Ribosomal RNA small subunit methyltransferase E n=1 Tax=Anaeromonas frigoriresistens TaxID=2683708 RepID=A0A942UPG4_9FIRM|nr:16S rRNA (uracil(1498)-N(3))-methyltransferase [Anaeromonas frigoriresistens]MBS4536879.1 16S rRNA (uracil(1498)-N(3))-methyltransferase [Anaeromonas frigoriresistens]
MNRFFVSQEDINDSIVTIKGDDIKHIKNVLRLKENDKISVCDNQDNEYIVKLDNILNEEVTGTIIEEVDIRRESNINITLYQGFAKGSKMDMIIQKATELGVKRIVPIITDRAIVKINDKKKEDKKIDRFNKIAMEASKQSKRGTVPEVSNILSLDKAIKEIQENGSFTIVPYEDENQVGVKDFIKDVKNRDINIIIGPEGGFEETEISQLKSINSKIVSLGPRILRTETAGFTAIAIVMYELGDIGVV